ncbi:hypothetical protein AAY473_013765 [Plecturocebus cupreus]
MGFQWVSSPSWAQNIHPGGTSESSRQTSSSDIKRLLHLSRGGQHGVGVALHKPYSKQINGNVAGLPLCPTSAKSQDSPSPHTHPSAGTQAGDLFLDVFTGTAPGASNQDVDTARLHPHQVTGWNLGGPPLRESAFEMMANSR